MHLHFGVAEALVILRYQNQSQTLGLMLFPSVQALGRYVLKKKTSSMIRVKTATLLFTLQQIHSSEDVQQQ